MGYYEPVAYGSLQQLQPVTVKINVKGVSMLIHDDIFSWAGFGGLLDLANGKCRLRIFDLSKASDNKVMLLKPLIVVVSDLPDHDTHMKKVSVRSCNSHIATCVARTFKLNPQRMVFVEYYPPSIYGDHGQHHIPAKYVRVAFQWYDDKAMHPKWQPLEPPLLDTVVGLIARSA